MPDPRLSRLFALLLALLTAAPALAQNKVEPFRQQMGDFTVANVQGDGPIEVPYILWGGDVATFVANGGLETKPGSIYADLGLNLKLVAGDDFPAQAKRYMEGQSPFLRGTYSMMALASEVAGGDPRTKPTMVLQLTYSAGDHLVTRAALKTISDLKGKTIAIQQGGPHLGMLNDILNAAQLSFDDVTLVFVKDITGPDGPAAKFKGDSGVDACFCVTPDMLGLVGGLDSVGSGAEGTVQGAKVLVSTAQMSRSIADVYCVRRDYYQSHRETVEKFVAGYLAGAKKLVDAKTRWVKDGGKDAEYNGYLKMTQDIYGKDVLPTLEVDAHGLIADATFVGLPGNVSFFTDKGNLAGFEAKQGPALALARRLGYTDAPAGFFPPDLDYAKIAKLAGLEYDPAAARATGRFDAESVGGFPDQALDDRTILSFTVNFDANQTDFPEAVYGPEFLRAVKAASTFGNAVIAVRGHADPTKALIDLVKSGLDKGILRREGGSGNYTYYYDGKPLDLEATGELVKLIESGAFDGGAENPRETMQAALNLSRARAESVRQAIIDFAAKQGYRLDPSQVQPVGVGIAEPLIAKPTNAQEAAKNRRVEFRLIKVPAEAVKGEDFDF